MRSGWVVVNDVLVVVDLCVRYWAASFWVCGLDVSLLKLLDDYIIEILHTRVDLRMMRRKNIGRSSHNWTNLSHDC